jgi:DNA-binding response OmpR family regulator
MLTALGQAANIKEGMEKSADAYIAKPFNTVALLGIIQGLVGR